MFSVKWYKNTMTIRLIHWFSPQRERQRWNTGIHHSNNVRTAHDSPLLLIADSLCHGFPPVLLPMFFHFTAQLEQQLYSEKPRFSQLFVWVNCFPPSLMPVKQTLCDLAEVILNKGILNSSSLKAGSSTMVWLIGECWEKSLPKMCWVGCKKAVMGRARQEGRAQGARGEEGG